MPRSPAPPASSSRAPFEVTPQLTATLLLQARRLGLWGDEVERFITRGVSLARTKYRHAQQKAQRDRRQEERQAEVVTASPPQRRRGHPRQITPAKKVRTP